MLDCVEQLIGHDLRYIGSKINVKPSAIGSGVDWHQDMAYGPVTNKGHMSILIYLDDADERNGCLQVIPGSPPMYDHSRGGYFQGRITENLDLSKAVAIEAESGTGIFFHGLVLHASAPNLSSSPRRTLILSYRAADAFPIYLGEVIKESEAFVRLVRGKESDVARFDPDLRRVHIPRYPVGTKSLYELQERSRREEAIQTW